MTDPLTDHTIVCGFGDLGRAVARELQDAETPYVVIGTQADSAMAAFLGIRFVSGDPSQPGALREAGLEQARALVACEPSDSDNIAIAEAARALRADVVVCAAVTGDEGEKTLRRAGVESVVSPARAAGAELARRALHPVAGERRDEGDEYRIEEITVAPNASGTGHGIAAVRGGAHVVGLRRADGSFLPQPPTEMVLRPGDVVIALGTPQTLARLDGLIAKPHRLEPPPPAKGLPRTSRRL